MNPLSTLQPYPHAGAHGIAVSGTILAQAAPAAPAPAPASDSYLVASIVLSGIGILLLGLELVIPTSGMLALLCGTCFVASIVAMFMWSASWGLVLLVTYLFAAPFVGLLLLKLWTKSPIVRKYTLNEGPSKVVGAEQLDAPDLDPDADAGAGDLLRFRRMKALAAAIGKRGVTQTPLRPAGFVDIDGQRVDAIAESGYVEPGVAVTVIAVVDGALKVREDA